MRRIPLAVAAASMLAAVALPASASAAEVQIGQTSTSLVAPTCPAGTSASACTILLTEETGYETLSDNVASPMLVKQPGVLSSYSVGISSAAKKYISGSSGLNATYGGPPEVAVTVLRPVGWGKQARWAVAAEGPVQNLTAYQGTVTQFPLAQALPLVKGEMVALTTPTWAPVLAINLSTSFAYVQSRTANCTGATKKTYYNPQTVIGEQTAYGCSFNKTRLEYSASEITTPTAAAAVRLAKRRRSTAKPKIIKRAK